MCPIAGIYGKNNGDVSSQIHLMLDTMCHKKPGEGWLIANDDMQKWQRDYSSKAGTVCRKGTLGQISFAKGNKPLERPYLDYKRRLSLLYEGKLYNYKKLRSKFLENHQLVTGTAAEVIIYLLEDRYQGDLEKALKQVLADVDGPYTIAVSNGVQTILVRDPVGKRPAYIAENNKYSAFASQKKALWKVGLQNVKPLRAGMLATFEGDTITVSQALPMGSEDFEIEIKDLNNAIDEYRKVLYSAIVKRMPNTGRVGVLVSGGVDSCLIAKLVNELVADREVEVIAYTAGLANAPDIDYAESFVHDLGLRHRVRKLSIDEVEAYISKVVRAIEERDFIQIEAGIGVYAAVEMASQDGIKIIFSGQGPDELWGGYSWYPEVIKEEGYQGFQQRMWSDLERGDIETLDRENKIAMAHGVEMVFPYLDMEVIKVAMSTSPRLKVSSKNGNLGKLPHRALAERVGVPETYANRPKDAAQHGTGIHDVLDEIAQRNGFTPELVEDIGYTSQQITKERLGSSSRYGYLFGEEELWTIPSHIQLFLDVIAYRNSLLNEQQRARIEQFLQKAEFHR
ncbi:MAG: asparagine synthetase B [Dehalococcoidales bacterium]|nr:asparagine synthetase B [Dehalococcoidales bacterium]